MFPSSVSLTAVNNALSLLHFTGRCSAKSLTTVPVPFRNKARSSCSVPQQSALVISARNGWNNLAAVRENRIFEIAGEDTLQPGFRLVHGYEQKKLIVKKNHS